MGCQGSLSDKWPLSRPPEEARGWVRHAGKDCGVWRNSEESGARQVVGRVLWPRGPRSRGWLYSQWNAVKWEALEDVSAGSTLSGGPLGYCCRTDWSEASGKAGGASRRPGELQGFLLDRRQGCGESMLSVFPLRRKEKTVGGAGLVGEVGSVGLAMLRRRCPIGHPEGGWIGELQSRGSGDRSWYRYTLGVTGLWRVHSRGLHAIPTSECAQRKKQGRLSQGTCRVQRSGGAEEWAERLKHFIDQFEIYT